MTLVANDLTGLFFTSRVFDKFYLNGNGFSFFRDNLISDWSVAKIPLEKGTEVIMKISVASQRKLSELFNKYADLDQGFADEVFRVYPLSHSQVKINYMHANPEVEFMIKRSIKTIIPTKN